MLTESLITSILQASLTGAGLVLAIYALILPISGRLFEMRKREIEHGVQAIKTKVEEIKGIPSLEKIEEIKKTAENLEEKATFPTYLGYGMALSFISFIITCCMSISWYDSRYMNCIDNYLMNAFGISIIIFFIVGLLSIKDIYSILNLEYQTRKQLVEEIKGETIKITTIEQNMINVLNAIKDIKLMTKDQIGYFIKGEDIQEKTGLSVEQINDAITLAYTRGYIKLTKILGPTFNFMISDLKVTGKMFLERIEENSVKKK
jgi:uncharacterized membrane protein